MQRNVLSTPKNWARLVHELCFSLNLAWALLFPLSTVGSSLGWLYFWPPMRKLFFYVHTIEPEVIAVQVVGSIGLALLLFSTLWLLGRSSFLETFLRTIAGIIGLAAFPMVALFFARAYFLSPDRSINYSIGLPWLLFEMALVCLFGFLFYRQQWPVPNVASTGIVLLHFSFWYWLTGPRLSPLELVRSYGSLRLGFWFSAIFYWGFPALGTLATLAWGFYVGGPTIKRVRAESAA